MKYKLIILLYVLLQASGAFGQEHIRFRDLSFSQAKEKALQENKLIFLDGFTSWCAPCKWMESHVFTQKEVLDYFNDKFINVKFDCEVGEGVEIAKKYQIRSFPTYLFIDHEGTLIYRTQSRMEAGEFLKQGKIANDPDYQIPGLLAKYKAGNRDSGFLLGFILVMSNVDQGIAGRAKRSLDSVANDAFLLSPEGWETIKMMAKNNNDKYGRFFQEHKAYFQKIAAPVDFEQKETQLLRYAMYGYIRSKQQVPFEEGLKFFEQRKDPQMQIEAAMLRVEWAGTNGTSEEFIQLTDQFRKGILKDEDEKLSFITRRFGNTKMMNTYNAENLRQCYVLAKQAVEMNPSSYSNQGTFADICISLKKKKEAVKAAEAARALAEAETSKIQKLADALVERAKSIK